VVYLPIQAFLSRFNRLFLDSVLYLVINLFLCREKLVRLLRAWRMACFQVTTFNILQSNRSILGNDGQLSVYDSPL
jgi:hypothetical protein